MRQFISYNLFALLVTCNPTSVFAAPLIPSLDGITSLVPTSDLSSTGTSASSSGSHVDNSGGNGYYSDQANVAANPNVTPTATTVSNSASASGLLDLANDVGNIVGNTVDTDTLSNNDGNSVLDGNQVANIDVGGDQGNGSGSDNGDGEGEGEWRAVKW